jgi:hypothetical protein
MPFEVNQNLFKLNWTSCRSPWINFVYLNSIEVEFGLGYFGMKGSRAYYFHFFDRSLQTSNPHAYYSDENQLLQFSNLDEVCSELLGFP